VHELSIALSILEQAAEESVRRGGVRVAAIHLRLGVLSGVVKEALISAFQLAIERSDFEQCRLLVEEIPVSGYCANCQAESQVQSFACLQCVACGALVFDILRGKELEISALELMR
jgi:hydrogenase nickel incorporation protein HypA/HybF